MLTYTPFQIWATALTGTGGILQPAQMAQPRSPHPSQKPPPAHSGTWPAVTAGHQLKWGNPWSLHWSIPHPPRCPARLLSPGPVFPAPMCPVRTLNMKGDNVTPVCLAPLPPLQGPPPTRAPAQTAAARTHRPAKLQSLGAWGSPRLGGWTEEKISGVLGRPRPEGAVQLPPTPRRCAGSLPGRAAPH